MKVEKRKKKNKGGRRSGGGGGRRVGTYVRRVLRASTFVGITGKKREEQESIN